ncbi:MAG: type I methionyl aminopeptidase [Chloroflexaceae bacterium]|jgi:methionyl aminopeptidase|nr:type I methionyl aminopeptidase [Chloroflexaceae bacterium]
MPVTLKSQQQIEMLRAAGHLVRETFEMLRDYVRPGVTTAELDAIAEEFIRRHGAEPVYKGYIPPGHRTVRRGEPPFPPFPGSICASVNDVICHGIPSPRIKLRQGDIIGVDIGLRLNGWIGDACVTYPVGQVDARTQKLLETTQECLRRGIEQARPGNSLRDVGAAIQRHAESQGFSVVREYTGHGLGRNLHEEPTVLHYDEPKATLRLRPGMVFTIEPMVNAGKPGTKSDPDRWTVRTADGSRSAQFEHTIAITEDGPILLTV